MADHWASPPPDAAGRRHQARGAAIGVAAKPVHCEAVRRRRCRRPALESALGGGPARDPIRGHALRRHVSGAPRVLAAAGAPRAGARARRPAAAREGHGRGLGQDGTRAAQRRRCRSPACAPQASSRRCATTAPRSSTADRARRGRRVLHRPPRRRAAHRRADLCRRCAARLRRAEPRRARRARGGESGKARGKASKKAAAAAPRARTTTSA